MSEDASYELRQAIVRTLKADSAVSALIQGRIYDRVPKKAGNIVADFPYVSFGPEQDIPAHIDCIAGGDIFLQIDVWSRAVNSAEGKRVAQAIKVALEDADLSLGDNALVCLSYEGRQVLADQDGLTTHVALTFQASVEEH